MNEKKEGGRSAPLLESRDALLREISRRLELLLKDAGHDSESLAERMGGAVSPQAIRLWRTGKRLPSLEAVPLIARALGVPPGWLAYGQGGS